MKGDEMERMARANACVAITITIAKATPTGKTGDAPLDWMVVLAKDQRGIQYHSELELI